MAREGGSDYSGKSRVGGVRCVPPWSPDHPLSRPLDDGRTREIAAQRDTFERDVGEPGTWAFITAQAAEAPTYIDLLLPPVQTAAGDGARRRPAPHSPAR